MIWHARNLAGRCAALDAVTRKRRNSSRNPFPPPSAEEDAEADAKAATKRATRSDPADRRARAKSGVRASQKASRKRRPPPPPPPEEERSAASSRSFRGCTAWDARHSSSTRATSRAIRWSGSPAPVTAAAGAMGCRGRGSGGRRRSGVWALEFGKGRILNRGEGSGVENIWSGGVRRRHTAKWDRWTRSRDGRCGLVKWFPLGARAGPDGARLATWTTRGVEDSPLFQTL